MIRKPEITKKTSTPMKPPWNPGKLDVVADDQDDGDGPQPVDVPAEAPFPGRTGRSGGFGAGTRPVELEPAGWSVPHSHSATL